MTTPARSTQQDRGCFFKLCPHKQVVRVRPAIFAFGMVFVPLLASLIVAEVMR
jgi:hypothetical protein